MIQRLLKLVKTAIVAVAFTALTAAVLTTLFSFAYTYRFIARYGIVRINRLTQEISVMCDGKWMSLDTWTDRIEEDYRRRESKRIFSQQDIEKTILVPNKLWAGPMAMLAFKIYNGTSRPINKIRVRIVLEPAIQILRGDVWEQEAERQRKIQSIDQPLFQTCIVPPHSWAYTTISVDNIPEQLDGWRWSAELVAAKSDSDP